MPPLVPTTTSKPASALIASKGHTVRRRRKDDRRITGGPQEDHRRITGGSPATLDPMRTRAAQDRHSDRDPLLTVAQAGEYLGTGERFIRRLITERRIDYVKVGKYVRLERSTLDAFVDSGRVHSQR